MKNPFSSLLKLFFNSKNNKTLTLEENLSSTVRYYLSFDDITNIKALTHTVQNALEDFSLQNDFTEKSHILDLHVFKPFNTKIAQLAIPPFEDNRRRTKEREMLEVKTYLEEFLNNIFNDFSATLKESFYYNEHKTKSQSCMAKQRDFLINPYLEDESYPIAFSRKFREIT